MQCDTYNHLVVTVVAGSRWRAIVFRCCRLFGSGDRLLAGWDASTCDDELHEPTGLLENAYGLLVGYVSIERLPINSKNLISHLKAPIAAKKEIDKKCISVCSRLNYRICGGRKPWLPAKRLLW